jgi:hypothetical protein
MAAVMDTEIRGEKWVHERLERWGKWSRCSLPGGSGSAEGYLRERLDHSYDDPSDEIMETDKAVARVKIERKDYYRVIRRFYIGELSEYEISLDIGETIDRVTAMLRQSRFLVCYKLLQLPGKSLA